MLIAGTLLFGAAAGSCQVSEDEAVDKASGLATSVAKTAAAIGRDTWYEPVDDPVLGPWGPTDGDHVNADLEAIDYMGETGTSIYAMASGVVAFAGENCDSNVPNKCYGNVVAVEHKHGIYSIYTHLSALPDLNKGDDVTRETVIGYMGESGCEGCGAHLHFVVRKNKGGLEDNSALFPGTPVPIRDGKLKPR